MHAPVMHMILTTDAIHTHSHTINTGILRQSNAGLPVANGLPRRREPSGKTGVAKVTQPQINCHCEVIPRCLFRAAPPHTLLIVDFHIANQDSILVEANKSHASFRSTTHTKMYSVLCVTQSHACMPTVSARRAGCVIKGKNPRPRQAGGIGEGS